MPRSLLGIISTITLSLWLGFTLWATHAVWNGNTHIYAENGPLENVQACVLAAAFLVYLVNAATERQSSRLILLSCSLLCYSFMLRELDVEQFDLPHPLIAIASGTGRNVTLAIAFAALLFYAVKNFSYYKTAALQFLRTRSGVLLMLAGVFLYVAEFFEKNSAIPHHVLWEEVIELFAFTLILLSAFTANALIRRTTVRCGERARHDHR